MSATIDSAGSSARSAAGAAAPATPVASRILRVDAAALFACAAVAAGAYFFGVAPVLDARAQVEEKRRLIDEQSRNAEDAEQLLSAERSKLQALQRQLAATSVKLTPAGDLNRRLAVISELVEQHGLEMHALDPGTPTSDRAIGKFSLVPIRLSGVGPFTSISAFLHELLANRYADMEVRSMSIAAVPASATQARPGVVPLTARDGAASQNPAGEKGSFSIELRWYAAPAVSAGAGADR